MGTIYIIENNVNSKKYIGATTQTINCRKSQYKKAYNNPKVRDYNYQICTAMRQIGFDNFTFSVIEECDNNILDEREKYWIEYYDSVKNGYNEALGGKGKPLWTKKQLLACKDLYEKGWTLEDLADIFNSNSKTVSKKLRNEFKINTSINGNVYSKLKPVKCINGDKEIKIFSSRTEAAKWLIDSQLCSGHSVTSLCSRINNAINTGKLLHKMKWQNME